MDQKGIFLHDEAGTDAVSLRVDEGCRGYTCLDNGSAPLAMSYTPMQKFEELYTPAEAWQNGTLFRKLNLPFVGKR